MRDSLVLMEDLKDICMCSAIPWKELKHSTFLITGATGMLGSLLIKTLLEANDCHSLGIKIIAVVRDRERAEALFQDKRVNYYVQDIRTPLEIAQAIDFVIHCACVTTSKVMAEDPVGTIDTAVTGTLNVLRAADAHQIKSMVYLSSMEAYGSFPEPTEVDEETLGFIDLSNSRSSYPESKRMCECLCSSFYNQKQLPVKTARLAQIFGAGTSREDSRIYAQLAKSVMQLKDIVLHTEGNSVGNYCYTSDAVKGIFLILLRGKNGGTYNVSHEANVMTIKQMAEMAAERVAAGKISCSVQIPENGNVFGYAPVSRYKLNADKLRKLGWEPQYLVPEMYRRMISDWSGV